MDPDIALTLGIVVMIFAIPSVLSAMTDSRAPRASALTVLIGGGLVVYALQTKPGGYTFNQVPHTFVDVAARFLP